MFQNVKPTADKVANFNQGACLARLMFDKYTRQGMQAQEARRVMLANGVQVAGIHPLFVDGFKTAVPLLK